MQIPPRRYLFFVTNIYSIPILMPLHQYIEQHTGGDIRWFTAGNARNESAPGRLATSSTEVISYQPEAVIVPGNVVPYFWPGLKVQIFHGLGEEKRGHYRITGFFDLYCTPGPYLTQKFALLAQRYGHFMVAQTGWPKLDLLKTVQDRDQYKRDLGFDTQRPVLLYAPTFSSKYSSAGELYPAIRELLERPFQWAVKFHDLMDPDVKKKYASISGDNLQITDHSDILPLLAAADILITDTSSVAYEFLTLDRPIITFRATARLDKGIDLKDPSELGPAVKRSLDRPDEFARNRQRYLQELHPYQDGESSRRVLESIENVLQNNLRSSLKRKPLNWVRKWQIRKLMG